MERFENLMSNPMSDLTNSFHMGAVTNLMSNLMSDLTNSFYMAAVTNPGLTKEKGNTPYMNYVHASGKVLLCTVNHRSHDKAPETKSERIFWSDLLVACCSKLVVEHQVAIEGPRESLARGRRE